MQDYHGRRVVAHNALLSLHREAEDQLVDLRDRLARAGQERDALQEEGSRLRQEVELLQAEKRDCKAAHHAELERRDAVHRDAMSEKVAAHNADLKRLVGVHNGELEHRDASHAATLKDKDARLAEEVEAA